MKKNRSLALIWLFLTVLSSASSCSGATLAPQLRDRRLRVCTEKPCFYYEWEECVSHVLGICTKKEWRRDEYDLTDPAVRKQMVDMGASILFDGRWQ